MTGQEFAANAACVREREIAFPPSSLFFVPTITVGSIWRCKYLTARASRNCRSLVWAIRSGRFVRRMGEAASLVFSIRDTSMALRENLR